MRRLAAQEIKDKLTAAGISFDDALKYGDLWELYKSSTSEEKPVTEEPVQPEVASTPSPVVSVTPFILPGAEQFDSSMPSEWRNKKTHKIGSLMRCREMAEAVEVYQGVKFVRAYTKAVHGENYAQLAKQFTDKNNRNLE